jgi:anti-anti-sigma factor
MAEFATSTGPDGSLALAVAGELDISGVDEFLARAGDLVESGADPVDLDLGGVTFIDSSGLGALVRLQKTVTSTGRRLQLVNVPRPVSRILELTGLSDLFAWGPTS